MLELCRQTSVLRRAWRRATAGALQAANLGFAARTSMSAQSLGAGPRLEPCRQLPWNEHKSINQGAKLRGTLQLNDRGSCCDEHGIDEGLGSVEPACLSLHECQRLERLDSYERHLLAENHGAEPLHRARAQSQGAGRWRRAKPAGHQEQYCSVHLRPDQLGSCCTEIHSWSKAATT